MKQLQLAKIDVKVLQSPDGYLAQVARMLDTELESKPNSNAVIFLGPQERYREKVPLEDLHGENGVTPPFVFLRLQLPDDAFGGQTRPPGVEFPTRANSRMRRGNAPFPGYGRRPQVIQPDTISLTVAELSGKTVPIENPADLEKGIQEIKTRLGVTGEKH
jgi:hypothetical protein